MKVDKRVAALEALYAELPSLECQGLCGDCCHFIGMTRLEQGRIRRAGGPVIQIVDTPCPALDFMGRCSVYAQRPIICRLWGVVADMPCHYGCTPERYLTPEEGREFLARVQAIAGEEWVENVPHDQ
jgi:uncharacterized protein